MTRRCFLMTIALIMLMFTNANHALAIELILDNTTRHEISAAVSYYDPSKQGWVRKGWYNVPPHSRKSYQFNSSGDTMYIHGNAYSGNTFYEWPGGSPRTGDIVHSVITSAFEVVGSGIIRGAGQTNAVFMKLDVGNNDTYTFTFH